MMGNNDSLARVVGLVPPLTVVIHQRTSKVGTSNDGYTCRDPNEDRMGWYCPSWPCQNSLIVGQYTILVCLSYSLLVE